MKRVRKTKPAAKPANSTAPAEAMPVPASCSELDGSHPTAMAEAMVNAGIKGPATTPTSAPTPTAAPATKAGKKDYDSFFQLYATVVRDSDRCSLTAGMDGKASGKYFLPLGFIPGPAAVLEFRHGKMCAIDATTDVRLGMDVPTPWISVTGQEEGMPGTIWHTLGVWAGLLGELGHEPSPWNLGLARRLLEGEVPPQYLCMVMPRFRYRHGDPEVAFGIVLVPSGEKMGVSRVNNPGDIPGVPEVGTLLDPNDLADGQGPVQKMLKTWALMESNYSGRYDRYGRPHETRRRDEPRR